MAKVNGRTQPVRATDVIQPTPSSIGVSCHYTVAIDIASEKATIALWDSQQCLLLQPTDFENNRTGYEWLLQRLQHLAPDHQPQFVQIGLEVTGPYWESLYYFFLRLDYTMVLLNPQQSHQWSQGRGVRAKTDKLDTISIGRLMMSGEVRPVYVLDELTANYRELVRMQTNLSETAARFKNELHSLLVNLFPEFSQVFADPSCKTALGFLLEFPSAQAVAAASLETITARLKQLAPRNFGQPTALKLHQLAPTSVGSGVALTARSLSLRLLCEQLLAISEQLAEIDVQLDQYLATDRAAARLSSVPEFGPKTVLVLRAELGDTGRFKHRDQAVAAVGLDLTVRESGKWKGQTKLSKRGSGLVRKILYMAAVACLRRKDSPFRTYYESLVKRGLKGRKALMAVMRKMVAVAYSLLKYETAYDPSRVCAKPNSARAEAIAA